MTGNVRIGTDPAAAHTLDADKYFSPGILWLFNFEICETMMATKNTMMNLCSKPELVHFTRARSGQAGWWSADPEGWKAMDGERIIAYTEKDHIGMEHDPWFIDLHDLRWPSLDDFKI